ncbi:MAG TPA: winged helix-turn-helix domain-containing protein [Acidimicrobiales bacterium]|nr:winged helix-turn-helix domain-containing protein [Acidimicrobiales bacterium]
MVGYRFGEFVLDDAQFGLSGPAGPIHVEPQVFELLRYLILNHDRVVPKEELLDTIWGDRFVSESALTSRVKAARRAVGDDGQAQGVIKTVHGRGYRFVAAVRVESEPGRRALPRLRNAVFGRDRDIASVVARVDEAPLVTVTGPGGIGKTTVGLAVAGRLQDDFADGAVFVDLSPVLPHADITRAVAEAAGVEGGAADSIVQVADHLASRPVLLVMDNCEHVLDHAARLVDRMLAAGNGARVLATSREPLGVAGEHVWPLGPLHDEGPALFVERARAAEPRGRWDPADPAVVELCRRLDDVPLALELAAGQLRRFDLAELTRRLDDRLGMLAGRPTGEARHATMETAIDWSYRLLDAAEQALLRHLSVFPASFTVAAVEASAPVLPGGDVVGVFGGLVDKSLVVRLPGSGRYRLLETIRVFARGRLEDAGDTADAVERHRRHVRDRVASASRLDRWLSARRAAAYRADLEDARQAFRHSLEQGEVGDAVEIAVGASFLWRNAIGCAEGDAWVAELAARDLSPDDELWVHILGSDVGQGRGDPGQMFAAPPPGEGGPGDPDDDPAGACVLAHYHALARLTEPASGRPRLARALDLARRSGDDRLTTMIEIFFTVADLAAGDYDQARAEHARLDRVASEDGYDRFLLHWAGWMLGLAERNAVTARRWMSRQQDFLDRTGIVETWITSFSTALCDVVEGGDVVSRLAHTLDLADREGYRADADCVLVLAYAAICAERPSEAAELIGTATHGRFNATALYVLYSAVLDRPLRGRLDAAAMAEAAARGRERTPAEALAGHGIARAVTSPRGRGW